MFKRKTVHTLAVLLAVASLPGTALAAGGPGKGSQCTDLDSPVADNPYSRMEGEGVFVGLSAPREARHFDLYQHYRRAFESPPGADQSHHVNRPAYAPASDEGRHNSRSDSCVSPASRRIE